MTVELTPPGPDPTGGTVQSNAGDTWEWCPDCGHYFTGAHLCDKSREAVLARVEAKLDRILQLLAGRYGAD